MKQNVIIIAGSGRSGTTWVQDSLAIANQMQTVFEPLHPVAVPEARKFSYKYVDAEANEPELKEFMDFVLFGETHNLWMNYRIRKDRFNVFRVGVTQATYNLRKLMQHYKLYKTDRHNGAIVKFIRANLMLPWLSRTYGLPILLITRHPCAVIASRLDLGGKDWASQQSLDRYRSDQSVVDLIKREFSIDITDSFSTIEALTCVWCIENILPIRWSKTAGYLVASYEKLLTCPEQEWGRIICGLGLQNVPAVSMRESPSQQVSKQMQGMHFTKGHVGKWRQNLSNDQIGEISSILERFSYSGYSVNNDLPVEI